jgi:hypothetical protein
MKHQNAPMSDTTKTERNVITTTVQACSNPQPSALSSVESSPLNELLNPQPSSQNQQLIVPPLSSANSAALVDAKPLPPPAQPRKIRRNGRIASLPKRHRDMVNRMIMNGAPYKNIVSAVLDAAEVPVTERNISNWATGGYLEWRMEQEHVLQNRLDQDHLVDFLRRDDAAELPEVGLQAAATRLSQVLLQKLARADDPEAHIDNYSRMVDLLCRLNREIAATQKLRDDSRRTLGRHHDPALVKDHEALEVNESERFFTDPPADSGLACPAEPPALPPIPTATILTRQAAEQEAERRAVIVKHNAELLKTILAKNGGNAQATK